MNNLAHAKINLFLAIGNRRNEEMHRLYSIFARISLADEIHIKESSYCKKSGQPEVALKCSLSSNLTDHYRMQGLDTVKILEDLRSPNNLVSRAISMFFGYNENILSVPERIEVSLHKNIPQQAGLGGGSADAACVLRYLSKRFQSPLPDSESLAVELGDDIPPCLANEYVAYLESCKNIYVLPKTKNTRRNEFTSESEFFHYVLLKPPMGSATKSAFSLLNRPFSKDVDEVELVKVRDLLKTTAANFELCLTNLPTRYFELPNSIEPIKQYREGFTHPFHNDFENQLLNDCPVLREIKLFLKDKYNLPFFPSGSGSAWLFINKDKSLLSKAFEDLAKYISPSWFVDHGRFLS